MHDCWVCYLLTLSLSVPVYVSLSRSFFIPSTKSYRRSAHTHTHTHTHTHYSLFLFLFLFLFFSLPPSLPPSLFLLAQEWILQIYGPYNPVKQRRLRWLHPQRAHPPTIRWRRPRRTIRGGHGLHGSLFQCKKCFLFRFLLLSLSSRMTDGVVERDILFSHFPFFVPDMHMHMHMHCEEKKKGNAHEIHARWSSSSTNTHTHTHTHTHTDTRTDFVIGCCI